MYIVKALGQYASRGEYCPVMGIPELRSHIATHYSKRDNRIITPEDVIIGPGSKELLYLIQLACQDSTSFTVGMYKYIFSCIYIFICIVYFILYVLILLYRVVIYIHTYELLYISVYITKYIFFLSLSIYIDPSWVTYPAHMTMLNKKHTFIKTTFEEDWKVNKNNLVASGFDLESDTNSMLILNTPNNPTGLAYTEEELSELAGVFKTTKTIVISDEIYEHLQCLLYIN